MDKIILSVDLGTTFIKAAAFDLSGHLLASARAAVNADASIQGQFLQKGEEIFASVLECLSKVSAKLGTDAAKVAGLGFTGQMAGVIGVDENWNDITTWSCSMDSRYLPYADEMMEKYADLFLEIGGTNSPLMAPKCLWFTKEFPEKAAKVRKYMLLSSYVLGLLGEVPIEQATVGGSYVTWTGLADVKKKQWSEKLCEASGITVSQLPEIVDATAVCGHLSEKYAAACGLPAGLPLVCGAGDKIAGCVGTGILSTGDAVFETSSYGALSCVQPTFRVSDKHDYDAIPACSGTEVYLHRYLPGSGITLQWFMDTFGGDFAGIEPEIAELPCGSEGLMAVGLLGGTAMPLDGSIHGAWVGHSWHHRKAHFYRALLESFAYELADTMNSVASQYPDWDRFGDIHVIGGGISSGTWMQILADVTGCRMKAYDDGNIAMWGTAILTGCGLGEFADLSEISHGTLSPARVYSPVAENRTVYLGLMPVYQKLKADLAESYKALNGG